MNGGSIPEGRTETASNGAPPDVPFTPAERRIVDTLRTPRAVQAWLNRLPYNTEKGGGTQRSFELRAPVEVVVGNASGVRITYNGKPFDVASHATRNIARFRLE